MVKDPFVAAEQDSCGAKGVTPIPIPVRAFTPWFTTQGDVTLPSGAASTLCSPYSFTQNFCTSKQNPLQHLIMEFDYDEHTPHLFS
jgi:hypothetical protein